MLLIRTAQLDALRTMNRRAFEEEMLVHLRQFASPPFAELDDQKLLGMIRLGLNRAGHYGLTRRGPVRLHLELMLLFGNHYDTDPQYPWAAATLANPDSCDQIELAHLLYTRAVAYRDQVIADQQPGRDFAHE